MVCGGMKTTIFATVLTVIGGAALAFGAWGRFTKAGRARYDEMDGMYPGASLCLGIFLLLVAAVLWILAFARK